MSALTGTITLKHIFHGLTNCRSRTCKMDKFMKTPHSLAFASAIAGLIAILPFSAASAAPPPSAASPVPVPASAQAVGESDILAARGTSLLASTFVANSALSVPYAAGFVAIDQGRTLTCPATGGACRIEADQVVQVIGGSLNNRWAICTRVDGVDMDKPLCPFQGVINPAIFQTGAASQQKINISAGSHTVQSFLYTDSGANRGIFSIQYRIYQ